MTRGEIRHLESLGSYTSEQIDVLCRFLVCMAHEERCPSFEAVKSLLVLDCLGMKPWYCLRDGVCFRCPSAVDWMDCQGNRFRKGETAQWDRLDVSRGKTAR